MKYQFGDLVGFKIEASDGSLGSVHDLLFEDETWVVRYIVADTGGWLFGRKVLIAPQSVYEPDGAKHVLQVKLTKQQVKDSPDVEHDSPITREQEARYRDYYQLPYYWNADNALDVNAQVSVAPEATTLGSVGPVQAEAPPIPKTRNEPMLRSARKLKGFQVLCGEHDAGEVVDLMIDGAEWHMSFLVTELGTGSRKVLLPVGLIENTDWDGEVVVVGAPLETLESAPSYDETVSRDGKFLQGVTDHYSRNV